jgi:hypothetical protein
MNVYFSDVFVVDPDTIEKYGAFNISLINDLPLFIDPFLLFNSPKPEYQILHSEMLKYVRPKETERPKGSSLSPCISVGHGFIVAFQHTILPHSRLQSSSSHRAAGRALSSTGPSSRRQCPLLNILGTMQVSVNPAEVHHVGF